MKTWTLVHLLPKGSNSAPRIKMCDHPVDVGLTWRHVHEAPFDSVVVAMSRHRDVVQRSPTERLPTRLGSIAHCGASRNGRAYLPFARQSRAKISYGENQGRIET
jgi:hypothetical protein